MVSDIHDRDTGTSHVKLSSVSAQVESFHLDPTQLPPLAWTTTDERRAKSADGAKFQELGMDLFSLLDDIVQEGVRCL